MYICIFALIHRLIIYLLRWQHEANLCQQTDASLAHVLLDLQRWIGNKWGWGKLFPFSANFSWSSKKRCRQKLHRMTEDTLGPLLLKEMCFRGRFAWNFVKAHLPRFRKWAPQNPTKTHETPRNPTKPHESPRMLNTTKSVRRHLAHFTHLCDLAAHLLYLGS